VGGRFRGIRRATLAGSLSGLVALAATPAISPAQAAVVPEWLDHLNAWRTQSAVSALTEDPTWSAGDVAHSQYMVKDDQVTHYELSTLPYYTVAGDTAAKDGNIEVNSTTSFTDDQAIDWWMAAPFHAMGMMDPRLTQTGYGAYREVKSGWQAGFTLDVLRGNSFTGGTFPVYFPGNGATVPLTQYRGGESPDPLQGCPGYATPTGLPLFIELGGNVSTSVTAHSFTANGLPLAHCVIDTSNAALGSSLKYRGGVIVIPQKPLGTGVTYAVSLTVNGAPYSWSFSIGALKPFVTTPCTSVTATTTPASGGAVGTPVQVNATAAGCPNPRYRFWIRTPDGHWSIAQNYSSASSFTWAANGAAGAYGIEVDARDASELVAYDSVTNLTYQLSGCGGATISPSIASPQLAGVAVTFTAGATCAGTPTYRFWVAAPGGAWQIKQDYGTANTYAWTTAGLASGLYRFEVDVRNAGSTAAYDTVANATFQLGVTPCATPALSPSPGSPRPTGATVTLTASTTGCPNPRYRFWVQAPGGAWHIAQDYGATASFAWASTGAAGTYHLEVDVRDAAESVAYDAVQAVTYQLAGCTAASLSANPASPQAHGTPITLTATATCPGTPSFRFWVRAPGGSWQIARDYASSNTFAWTPGTAGTWSLEVDVRDAGATASYEVVNNTLYTLS